MKKRIEHHTVPGINVLRACHSARRETAHSAPPSITTSLRLVSTQALALPPAFTSPWPGDLPLRTAGLGGGGGPSISNSDVEYIGIVLMWGILAQGTEVQYLASRTDRSSIDRVIPVELTRSGRERCDSAREASRSDMVLGGQAIPSHSHERRSQRDAREALRSALRWEWGVV